MRRLAAAVVAVAALAACSSRPTQEPLQLDGNRLTIDNRSARTWSTVEIWVNSYYRVVVPSLPRFDFHRMQVRDLRLIAKLPDGSPLEIKKDFSASTLADAFKGVGGKR